MRLNHPHLLISMLEVSRWHQSSHSPSTYVCQGKCIWGWLVYFCPCSLWKHNELHYRARLGKLLSFQNAFISHLNIFIYLSIDLSKLEAIFRAYFISLKGYTCVVRSSEQYLRINSLWSSPTYATHIVSLHVQTSSDVTYATHKIVKYSCISDWVRYLYASVYSCVISEMKSCKISITNVWL